MGRYARRAYARPGRSRNGTMLQRNNTLAGIDFVEPGQDGKHQRGRWFGLAEAARSPRQAAATIATSPADSATSTASATTATSAAPAAAAPAAAASAATAACQLYPALGLRRVLLVEDVKRRQTDVGDFLVTQSDLMARRIIRRLGLIAYWCNGCRRASHQRKGQTGRAKCWQGVCHSLLLRSMFHSWHIRILHCFASGSSWASLLQGLTTRKAKALADMP